MADQSLSSLERVEDHRIVLGDCLAEMLAMPDGSADSILSDPPFEAEAHTLQRRTRRPGGAHDGGTFDKPSDGRVCVVEPLSFPPITEPERVAFAEQAARISRRWVIVFCQAEAVAVWRDTLEAAGLVYRRACVWIKPDAQPQLSGDRPGMGYESMVCAHRPGRSRWNGGGKVGVYTFNKNESKPHRHPTQKPVLLMEALVRDFTDQGELILDPFAGSGTTLVACKRLGRRALGFERDPAFHNYAVKRLDAARQQFELRPRIPSPKQSNLSLPEKTEEETPVETPGSAS